jgi:tRNA modification GTPase
VNLSDTIVAVSSPPGRGRRGLVRLSGQDALRVAALEEFGRGCHRVTFDLDGDELPTLAVVAPSPGSYTGEDVVELLVPGGEPMLARVQDALQEAASRQGTSLRRAEAGEFTARAYFNGRIGLLEAEGIAEAIRAETDSHLRAANLMTGGGLSHVALELVDELTRLAALVEAGIDFTDQEDVVAISNQALNRGLEALIRSLGSRLADAVSIERLESVPRVVLAGVANAGKSSLFNALLGTERTVVADVEGTTRDVVIEPLRLKMLGGDLEILLADVAGFGGSPLALVGIEEAMQRRALEAIERADLILRCTPPGGAILELETEAPILDIATKSDLAGGDASAIRISASTGEGITELAGLIAARLGGATNVLGAGAFAISERHRDALQRTLDAMQRANRLVLEDRSGRMPPAELVAACLRDGLDALGELVGRITPDQVLEHVFARFCVGK